MSNLFMLETLEGRQLLSLPAQYTVYGLGTLYVTRNGQLMSFPGAGVGRLYVSGR